MLTDQRTSEQKNAGIVKDCKFEGVISNKSTQRVAHADDLVIICGKRINNNAVKKLKIGHERRILTKAGKN